MTFDSTITLGDVAFVVTLIFMAGVAYQALRSLTRSQDKLELRVEKIEGVLTAQVGHLQRVIGAFEQHVRMPHTPEGG